MKAFDQSGWWASLLQWIRPQSKPGEAKRKFGRDWDLEFTLPKGSRNQVLGSMVNGTVDLELESENIHLLLCAQPKSASLYFCELLANCFDFQNVQIGFDQRGGPIYYPRLVAATLTGRNTVSHCHAEPSRVVRQIIENLPLTPLVLTRNLLDSLVSRRDMLARDKYAANLLSDAGLERFVQGSDAYQLDVIIELFASEYINFFEGWRQFEKEFPGKAIFATYEQIVNDQHVLLSEIARRLNLEIVAEKIELTSRQIASQGGINFSTGRIGRGELAFSKEQVENLRKKAAMLGCHDEAFLGFSVDKRDAA